MAYSEDHIALAAEYALGTLAAEERTRVETMMSLDTDFTELVRVWEYRLGALNQMVGPVEPRPIVWESIRSAIGRAEPQPPPPPHEPEAESSERVRSAIVDTSNVIALTSQAMRWRGIASAVSAIAAALVAILGIEIFAPGLLPDALRPPPRTRVLEVKTHAPVSAPAAQYVALLQGQGGGPAFILTVDSATRDFTLRRVGAAPAEPGKAYELWLISDKLPRPRSLGVIEDGDFTARPVLSSYDAEVINNATYAVTVEQAGGSPDGAPHSAPLYSGKLIETVPAGALAPSSAPAEKR
jgi:anti-sigma-K factor RskA